ncbi:hypothetical protein EXIGLDRAFT_32577 [Exidia glandulosa HHB12029]|uniref:Uncharacterized protein n=1 Tax=Exidia glandulosa HHB12029 TaxID=1314781 RepID=A0A166MV91_EXIGL|nr:hypothetical protein EXIGLDRAFT_32577 [Exidia glandulosa HHB12029]
MTATDRAEASTDGNYFHVVIECTRLCIVTNISLCWEALMSHPAPSLSLHNDCRPSSCRVEIQLLALMDISATTTSFRYCHRHNNLNVAEPVRRETLTLREVTGPSDAVAPNSCVGALTSHRHD